MTIKRVGLALIAALSLNGTAPAQTTESVPPAGGGFSPASPTNAGAVASAITVGWNNVHPTALSLPETSSAR